MPLYDGTRMDKWPDYKILPAQVAAAKKVGVTIKPSTNKLKKVDVFNKKGEKVASIGGRYYDGVWYGDYHTYKKTKKDRYNNDINPDERRRLYLARHRHEDKTENGIRTPSFYADKILW